MSEELKPCPFCGGPAVYGDEGQNQNQRLVRCEVIDSVQTCPGQHGWHYPAAWNRRSPASERMARLEAWKAMILSYRDNECAQCSSGKCGDEDCCDCPDLTRRIKTLQALDAQGKGEP